MSSILPLLILMDVRMVGVSIGDDKTTQKKSKKERKIFCINCTGYTDFWSKKKIFGTK